MRFLHTSDWHLGRTLCGERLIDDQAHALDQLVRIVKESRLDAVLVAGDVYDRAVPSPEAVRLLDEIVSQLVFDCGVHVLMIAGNHDSAARLGFGSRVMARHRLHLFGGLREGPHVVRLADDSGEVAFCAVPYLEPALAADELACPSICDHDTALRAAIERIRAVAPGGRSVLMAHAFVAGGEVSESERTLTVGGAGTVAPDALAGFDYTALGHLHRAQVLHPEALRYSGSILKYAFSEEAHRKSVELVEMDAAGGCRVERIPLAPRREVRTLRGRFDDLVAHPAAQGRDDLLAVTLLDTAPILEAKTRLSEVYPNVLQVLQPEFQGAGGARLNAKDYRSMDPCDLFAAFFQQVAGRDLTAEELEEFQATLEAARRAEREVVV